MGVVEGGGMGAAVGVRARPSGVRARFAAAAAPAALAGADTTPGVDDAELTPLCVRGSEGRPPATAAAAAAVAGAPSRRALPAEGGGKRPRVAVAGVVGGGAAAARSGVVADDGGGGRAGPPNRDALVGRTAILDGRTAPALVGVDPAERAVLVTPPLRAVAVPGAPVLVERRDAGPADPGACVNAAADARDSPSASADNGSAGGGAGSPRADPGVTALLPAEPRLRDRIPGVLVGVGPAGVRARDDAGGGGTGVRGAMGVRTGAARGTVPTLPPPNDARDDTAVTGRAGAVRALERDVLRVADAPRGVAPTAAPTPPGDGLGVDTPDATWLRTPLPERRKRPGVVLVGRGCADADRAGVRVNDEEVDTGGAGVPRADVAVRGIRPAAAAATARVADVALPRLVLRLPAGCGVAAPTLVRPRATLPASGVAIPGGGRIGVAAAGVGTPVNRGALEAERVGLLASGGSTATGRATDSATPSSTACAAT